MGGQGAQVYADAVATYLAFSALHKLTDRNSNPCDMGSQIENMQEAHTFRDKRFQMVWDFAEVQSLLWCSGGIYLVGLDAISRSAR